MEQRQQTVGVYSLDVVLGQGGMGTVYRGKNRQTGEAVAIKILKPEITASNPDLIVRFDREAEILRQLNHPNIVRVLTTLQEKGQHYIVMEYVSGGDLGAALKRQSPLPLARVLKIAIELADALTRAHYLKIVHRDLKPANVLIADDGTPRLTDFGVAHVESDDRLTEAGTAVGTLDYLPPEALKGEVVDVRADIWAFGVMLFEMLAGHHPFSGGTGAQVVTDILTQQPGDLELACPDAPAALVDLIYRMLEKDRDARIPSVRLVGAELEAIIEGGSWDTSSIGVKPATGKTRLFATPTPDTDESKHNLPAQATPFIGREHELEQLSRLLADPSDRLITILGPGGMGKTRLALQLGLNVVHQPHSPFQNGVYFVELAPLSDGANIYSAITTALDYQLQPDSRSPEQQLLDYLSSRHLLLVMDNYEHLIDGAHVVSEILQAAPNVKILVTSRQRLSQPGETLFHLSGMDFPDWETPEEALEYAAVKLFLNSGRRVQPDFELSAENLDAVGRICQLVQGMPLGIVLAATWLAILSPQEIAAEIEQSIDFLEAEGGEVPEHQRSIRAVFDHSWDLLSGEEQQSFMTLSVFRGGFTREAAEAVAGATLRSLMSLVNKSFIRRDAESGRYTIHELTRQYGEARLQEAGQAEAAIQHYIDYFAAYMVERELDIKGRRQLGALGDIDADYENVRSAWQRALERNHRRAINQMLEGLHWYQDMRGLFREAVGMLLATEAALESERDLAFYRVRTRRIRCTELSGQREDFPFEESDLREALAFARAQGQTAEVGFVLLVLGPMIFWQGDEEGLRLLDEAYQLYKGLDDPYYMSEILVWLSTTRSIEERKRLLREAIDMKQRIQDVSGIAWTTYNLGWAALVTHDYEEALSAAKRSMDYMRQVNNRGGMIMSSTQRAWMLLLKGDLAEARALFVQTLPKAQALGHRSGEVACFARLGLLYAVMDDDYEHCQQCARAIPVDNGVLSPGYISFVNALAAVGLGEFQTAEAEYAQFAQKIERRLIHVFPTGPVLAVKAVLEAHAGHGTRAVELLALAYHHPYQGTAWLDNWKLITRLRARLKAELGVQAYAAAWARGQALDFETTIDQILSPQDENQS